MSKKREICEAILARLDTVEGLKTKSFDRVRLYSSDFQDHELPAVQIMDVDEQITHEMSRAKKNWTLAIEIIMKPNEFGAVSQKDLWDMQHRVERALFADPNLSIPGVVHLHYRSSTTDLHLLEPFYYCRMEVMCQFYEALVHD